MGRSYLISLCCLIALIVSSVFQVSIRAQKQCGGIEGRATSREGVVIPKTSIRMVNKSNRKTNTIETLEDGSYTICLAPGRYDLEATALGYETVKRKSIDVDKSSKAIIDFVMKHNNSGWVDREHP